MSRIVGNRAIALNIPEMKCLESTIQSFLHVIMVDVIMTGTTGIIQSLSGDYSLNSNLTVINLTVITQAEVNHTDENRATADLIEEPYSVLHGVLVRSNTEKESEHEKTKEEKLAESHR